MSQQIAILIDGGYFLKRLSKLVSPEQCDSPQSIVRCVRKLCFTHVIRLRGGSPKLWQQHLYRVFFYDAQPYDGKAHHPISNKAIDFGKSEVALSRQSLFEQLRKERKLALRLGKVNRETDWVFAPRLTKVLLKTRVFFDSLERLQIQKIKNPETDTFQLQFTAEEATNILNICGIWNSVRAGDISLGLRQKGVDMRIAVDIASLTLKKQVGTIVLVTGDSDFVPAAKLARREGIEFILDPLWQNVNDDLFEHIDGLQSGIQKPHVAAQV